MSCANMGISQLECLQLRRLVGPTGIGFVSDQIVGNAEGTDAVFRFPLTYLPDSVLQGTYSSPTFTVPSGTGVMRVTIQTIATGGSPLYYKVEHGGTTSTAIPVFVGAPQEGFAGFYYSGLMFYTNPTSAPMQLSLTVGCQATTDHCDLLHFQVRAISFGPYVNQD